MKGYEKSRTPKNSKYSAANSEGSNAIQKKSVSVIQNVGSEEELQQHKSDTTLQKVEATALEEKHQEVTQHKTAEENHVNENAVQQKENKTGMPDNLKSGIENLSGMNMDHVRVNYNSSQPAQLNALAYAQGSDIHIAPGQEKHLPHEAWHVVQQAQGRVQPTTQMKSGVAVNDDPGLEHEADVMGEKALNASNLSLQKKKDSSLTQLKVSEEEKPAQLVIDNAQRSASVVQKKDVQSVALLQQVHAPNAKNVFSGITNSSELKSQTSKNSEPIVQNTVQMVSIFSVSSTEVKNLLSKDGEKNTSTWWLLWKHLESIEKSTHIEPGMNEQIVREIIRVAEIWLNKHENKKATEKIDLEKKVNIAKNVIKKGKDWLDSNFAAAFSPKIKKGHITLAEMAKNEGLKKPIEFDWFHKLEVASKLSEYMFTTAGDPRPIEKFYVPDEFINEVKSVLEREATWERIEDGRPEAEAIKIDIINKRRNLKEAYSQLNEQHRPAWDTIENWLIPIGGKEQSSLLTKLILYSYRKPGTIEAPKVKTVEEWKSALERASLL